MSDARQIVVCQRCRIGFMVTPNYGEFLARWGARVIVPVLCPACFTKAGPLPKQQGKVKWFSSRKRYGFIVTKEGKDVFFHQNQLLSGSDGKPSNGQIARFHTRYTVKGLEALNVELV